MNFTLDNDSLMIMVVVVMAAISLFFLIWGVYDCLKNEPEEGGSQITWLSLIWFTGGWGTLFYFLVRRPQRKKELGR